MGVSTEKVVIMGARPSKGQVEGVDFDFTELYLLENLDPETGFGSATVPFKFGSSQNFDLFKGQKSPLHAEIDIMSITNGRGVSRRVITAVRFNKP